MFKAKDASLVHKPPTIRGLIRIIVGLAGFLGGKGDGDPGSQTLRRGWQRMTDIREA
jgi:Transposase Tn5 dimerisation domain